MNFDDSRSRQVYTVFLSADAGPLLPSDFDSPAGLHAGSIENFYITRDNQHRISINAGDQMQSRQCP